MSLRQDIGINQQHHPQHVNDDQVFGCLASRSRQAGDFSGRSWKIKI